MSKVSSNHISNRHELSIQDNKLINAIIDREVTGKSIKNYEMMAEVYGYPIESEKDRVKATTRFHRINSGKHFKKAMVEARKEHYSTKIPSFEKRCAYLNDIIESNLGDDDSTAIKAIQELNRMFKDVDVDNNIVVNLHSTDSQQVNIDMSSQVLSILQQKHTQETSNEIVIEQELDNE